MAVDPLEAVILAAREYAQGRQARDPYMQMAKGAVEAPFRFSNPYSQLLANLGQNFVAGAGNHAARNNYARDQSDAYTGIADAIAGRPVDSEIAPYAAPVKLAFEQEARGDARDIAKENRAYNRDLVGKVFGANLDMSKELLKLGADPTELGYPSLGALPRGMSDVAPGSLPGRLEDSGPGALPGPTPEARLPGKVPSIEDVTQDFRVSNAPAAEPSESDLGSGISEQSRSLSRLPGPESNPFKAERAKKDEDRLQKIEDAARGEISGGTFETNFTDLKTNFETMQDTYRLNDRAGSRVFIQSFARIQDPGSRVSEGEIKNAESTQNILEQMGYSLESLIKGTQSLSPEARLEMLRAAAQKYNRYGEQYNSTIERTRERVERNGGRKENVYGRLDFKPFDLAAFAKGAPTPQTLKEELDSAGVKMPSLIPHPGDPNVKIRILD